jgi:DNA polymerase-3 subunit delta'
MPFADVIGHERAKGLLRSAILNERVAHAYLFHGPDRIGKHLLALRFMQVMACEASPPPGEPDACGRCRSCHQFDQGTHPDLSLIRPDPEQATLQIKIEDIRELESRLIYRPLIAPRKFCLIDDADAMNLSAANALLKTLEEPPGHGLLILVSSRPYSMPVTIRSRCQGLRLTPPPYDQSMRHLMVARGWSEQDATLMTTLTEGRLGEALLTDLGSIQKRHENLATLLAPQALRSATTILTAAEALSKEERLSDSLDRLSRWVRDLVMVGIGGRTESLTHTSHRPLLESIAKRADSHRLLDLLQEIDSFQRNSSRNLNAQLVLEHLLLRLRDAVAAVPPTPSPTPSRAPARR